MTPEQLSAFILAGVGIGIQLAIKLVPKFSDWYAGLENKGAWAVGFDVLFGLGFFGLGCIPLVVEMLNQVQFLTCDVRGAFDLLQAVWIIVLSQQATFLVVGKKKVFG